VNRLTQNIIVAVVGLITGVATLNGLFLNFVKPGLQWPLLVASAILVSMGAYGVLVEDDEGHAHRHDGDGSDGTIMSTTLRDAPEPPSGGGHAHTHGPRVGWLLVVPFLLLGVVVPPPLGAFSAEQDSGLVSAVQSADGLPELDPSTGPLSMTLSEYSARALFDERESLRGRTVRLTGFASAGPGGQGWVLTRMALNCCAADGYAVKVAVEGAERPPDNTWLEVVGTWVATPASEDPDRPGLPIVRIDTAKPIPQPENPYE
jgi:uncharacterized repeat protein (TIGR03943 family)